MPDVEVSEEQVGTNGISRRRFIGYLIAAPTLVAAADLRGAPPAGRRCRRSSRSTSST